jgi:hypothetical protein
MKGTQHTDPTHSDALRQPGQRRQVSTADENLNRDYLKKTMRNRRDGGNNL